MTPTATARPDSFLRPYTAGYNVFSMGQALTQERQAVHSSERTMPALCTLIMAGQTREQAMQLSQVAAFRLIFTGLKYPIIPSRAP